MRLLRAQADMPACLALRIENVNAVLRERGVGEAAPETVALAETLFRYLGSLWVAEYVHAGAFDASLNRYLFDSLALPVLTGQWVTLSQWVRTLFRQRGITSVIAGLGAIDFGDPCDEDHPVTGLLYYRNNFAHGSFVAQPSETAKNLARLEDLLAAAPALADQVPWFRFNGALHCANQGFDHIEVDVGVGEEELQPFVVSADGRVLSLYPLLHVHHDPEDGSFELRFGESGRNVRHATAQLLDREVLALYLARHVRERAGHLDFNEELAARCRTEAAAAGLEQLRVLLARERWQLLVVEGHPGCGAPHAIAQLAALAPEGRFARVERFVVEPDDLGQSGVVFAHFLLRRVEALLGLEAETYKGGPAALLDLLGRAKTDMEATGHRLLIGLLDLHHGLEPYRGETLRVVDVYGSLDSGPIQVVATVLPGHPNLIGHPLAWDLRLTLPLLEPDRIDQIELREALEHLAPPPPRLHRRILALLARADQPQDLFELCERLELQGGCVLTPEVERTLAELTPLLHVDEVDGVERYAIFSPLLRSAALVDMRP